jgi:hypothetical protein
MRRLRDARHPPYTYLLQQAKATNRCQAAIDLFVLVGSGLVTRKGPPRQQDHNTPTVLAVQNSVGLLQHLFDRRDPPGRGSFIPGVAVTFGRGNKPVGFRHAALAGLDADTAAIDLLG